MSLFRKPWWKAGRQGGLAFESAEGLMVHQGAFGLTDIKPRQVGIVAVVLDARQELGTDDAVILNADGTQQAILKVASPDGGFVIGASTAGAGGEALRPGNAVIWLPWTYADQPLSAVGSMDRRLGWIGYIMAKIKFEIDACGGPVVICRYG